MEKVDGLELPAFFSYYETPVKLVETPDGSMAAWKLVRDTGEWQAADNLVDKILFVGGDEVDQLTRDDFVQLTEYSRGRYLKGRGPLYALYETVGAITETVARERRYPSAEEIALIRGIQRRTFVMFEKDLQRAGAPGADPSLVTG